MLRRGFRVQQAMAMLQQRVNAVTKQMEWVVITEDEGDDAAVAETLATTSYLDMLNDIPRNKAFNAAINKTIRSPCNVLDIGAGTCLLSMMARRAMNQSVNTGGSVTACESYMPMEKLARRVLKENGFESKIHLINKRSDEMEVGLDLQFRADVLVCEILDSELLGEGVIPTLRHAHEHLLMPNCRTVPYRATVYGQLVECDLLWRFNDLEGAEKECVDGLVLSSSRHRFMKSRQHALHVDPLASRLILLSEPFEAFSIDFYKPPSSQEEFKQRLKIHSAGTAHAIISWWVLQLDEEGSVYYSTAPKWIKHDVKHSQSTYGSSWTDHWKQCVWFLGQGLNVCQGSYLDLVAKHDETAISYEIEMPALRNEGVCFVPDMNPERIHMLAEKKRRNKLKLAIQNALRDKHSATCLVIDDSLITPVLAASEDKISQVFTIFPGIKHGGMALVRDIADANGINKEKFVALKNEISKLTSDDFSGKKVDIVVAEPYYMNYERMLPTQQLRVWYERSALNSLLSEDAVILPAKGILYGMAFHLPDLWRSRCSLRSVVGFNHSQVNGMLGACGNIPSTPTFPFSIWQCGEFEALSDAFIILKFDMKQLMGSVSNCTEVSFKKSGRCHGVVMWMDWVMDCENNLTVESSPYDVEWKQGVKLLSNPMDVCPNNLVYVKAVFDHQSGNTDIQLTTHSHVT